MKSQIRLHTGKLFDPVNCYEHDIDIRDIAHGLANMPRFSGQTPVLYSVAQHSVLVSYLTDLTPMAGLLHDASEGLGLHDIASPLKHLWWMWPYRRAEAKLQTKIFNRFEVSLEDRRHADIKWADQKMFENERAALMSVGKGSNYKDGRILNGVAWHLWSELKPWSPAYAELRFLQRFRELAPNSIGKWRTEPDLGGKLYDSHDQR